MSPLPFPAAAACSGKAMASKDHLEDVKREVMVVGELVEILSGEQKYLQRKLERHIKTVVRGLMSCALLLWCGGQAQPRQSDRQHGAAQAPRALTALSARPTTTHACVCAHCRRATTAARFGTPHSR